MVLVLSYEKNQHAMHPTLTCMLHHRNTKYNHRPNATNISSSKYENNYLFAHSCNGSKGKGKNDNMEGHVVAQIVQPPRQRLRAKAIILIPAHSVLVVSQ